MTGPVAVAVAVTETAVAVAEPARAEVPGPDRSRVGQAPEDGEDAIEEAEGGDGGASVEVAPRARSQLLTILAW